MDRRRTFKDFFDMKKNDLQSYPRDAGQKVSGNKRELAQRAFENLDTNKALHVDPPNVNLDNDHASNQEIPEIGELTSGWSSNQYLRPTLSTKTLNTIC